jgi:hypothetical protein
MLLLFEISVCFGDWYVRQKHEISQDMDFISTDGMK